jgi:hypothetical protein
MTWLPYRARERVRVLATFRVRSAAPCCQGSPYGTIGVGLSAENATPHFDQNIAFSREFRPGLSRPALAGKRDRDRGDGDLARAERTLLLGCWTGPDWLVAMVCSSFAVN